MVRLAQMKRQINRRRLDSLSRDLDVRHGEREPPLAELSGIAKLPGAVL